MYWNGLRMVPMPLMPWCRFMRRWRKLRNMWPIRQQKFLRLSLIHIYIIIERAQETKEKFGTEDAKVFEDYRELLKEDLDVVYAVSYTHLTRTGEISFLF